VQQHSYTHDLVVQEGPTASARLAGASRCLATLRLSRRRICAQGRELCARSRALDERRVSLRLGEKLARSTPIGSLNDPE
jgi:hypothetical protein